MQRNNSTPHISTAGWGEWLGKGEAELVARDLGIERAQGDSEGLVRADGPLQIHRELVLAHATKLVSSQRAIDGVDISA